jgi:hypothetical protein
VISVLGKDEKKARRIPMDDALWEQYPQSSAEKQGSVVGDN